MPPFIPVEKPTVIETTQYMLLETEDNNLCLLPVTQSTTKRPQPTQDDLMNYSMNVCHWGLHLMNLNDTAKEGDVDLPCGG